ncbi:hypothetical protein VTJ49DRAFT_2727 [Mycothermus thermophilus]|uniref:Uncharacterized protein n=1 Tax=Humicola insolens TaxID=85995 RepID=A0ABR3VNQ7_HUMIN
MDATPRHPLFLSPKPPSDLVQFIIDRCTYPTVLLICSSRADFLSALTQDIVSRQQREQLHHRQRQHEQPPPTTEEVNETADLSHSKDGVPEGEDDRQEIGDGVDEEVYMDDDDEDAAEPSTSLHSISSNSSSSSRDIFPHHPPYPPHLQSQSHPLLTPTLAQLSTTRHIRTVFVPTVSHLRAFLSDFSLVDDKAAAFLSSTHHKPPPRNFPPLPPPPPPPPPQHQQPNTHHRHLSTEPRKPLEKNPLLLVYDFLALHRHTSEWSAQGIGASAAGLVEAAARTGLRAVVVEGRQRPQEQGQGQGVQTFGQDGGDGEEEAAAAGIGEGDGEKPALEMMSMEELLAEKVPILSGGNAKRVGGELGRKTVEVRVVLGRWFRFRDGAWWDGDF